MAHAQQHWPGKKQRALKIILSLCSLGTYASSVSGLYPSIVLLFLFSSLLQCSALSSNEEEGCYRII
jgi:hypothetical protein